MQSTNDFPAEAASAEEAPGIVPGGIRQWGGDTLKSAILFLVAPASLMIVTGLLGIRLPTWVLYGVAGIMGLAMVTRSFRDPEWLVAAFIVYMPLSRMFVASIGPGINATNMMILFLLVALRVRATREDRPMFRPMANSTLVGTFGAYTALSGITVIFTIGLSYLLEDELGEYLAWIDQFIVFFVILNLIRDGAMARRVIIYMMLGTLVAVAFGVQEMFDKMDLSSIEKSRVLGPQNQPNDFGGFLVYSVGPFLAIFLTELRQLRTWVLAPYFVLLGRLLVATFSRGAYLGLAFAGLMAGYIRGKAFLLVWLVAGVLLLIAMPQLIPESLVARMDQTEVSAGQKEELDTSSRTRLVLWNAAIKMSLESPVFGKGFKAFQKLKTWYTEEDVPESDNHNMYLWVSSQMGIPAVVMLLLILARMYFLGARLYRRHPEAFARAIGLGGVATAAGAALVNMFGSRMVSIDVDGYIWVYLAVMAHLRAEAEKAGAW
jgi:putative inorganic carbon (HCO3(-)) transporter